MAANVQIGQYSPAYLDGQLAGQGRQAEALKYLVELGRVKDDARISYRRSPGSASAT
jgi:hypothetical protein